MLGSKKEKSLDLSIDTEAEICCLDFYSVMPTPYKGKAICIWGGARNTYALLVLHKDQLLREEDGSAYVLLARLE